MRRTKIVATIGPASREPDVLEQLIEAGLDVARIGSAHGSLEEHLETHQRIRAAADRAGRNVATLIDLAGPKVRCAPFPEGGVFLDDNQTVSVVVGTEKSDGDHIAIDYLTVVEDVQLGDHLAIGDGKVTLEVVDKTADEVLVRTLSSGLVQGRPGFQIPSDRLRIGTPTPEDHLYIDAFVAAGVDMIAVSFVKHADDMRAVGTPLQPEGPLLIAKIETVASVTNLEQIIDASDAVMVARGDLGLDFPIAELPHLQKRIIRACVARGRPAITATQMLESMVTAPTPTRAEVSDVANAVFDGTSAVMLSGESAIGIDPVNAVATMAHITERAEREFDHGLWLETIIEWTNAAGSGAVSALTTDSISRSSVYVAEQVGAKAILCLSRTGLTARSVSRFRPEVPIIAFSPIERTVRQLALSWGVSAVLGSDSSSSREQLDEALMAVRGHYGIASGDLVVITSGQSTVARATNTLRVEVIP